MPSAPSNLSSCLPLFFLSRNHCPFYFSQLSQQWAKQRAKSWRISVFGGIFGNSPLHFCLILQSSLVQVLFFSAPAQTWLTKCNKITQISKPKSDLGALKLTAAPRRTKNLLQSFFYAVLLFGMKFPFEILHLYLYCERWWGGSARVAVSYQKQIIPSKSNKIEQRMSNPFQHVCARLDSMIWTSISIVFLEFSMCEKRNKEAFARVKAFKCSSPTLYITSWNSIEKTLAESTKEDWKIVKNVNLLTS